MALPAGAPRLTELAALRERVADIDQRLESLYDALETKRLSANDLAPRIQDRREKRELILRALAEAEEMREQGRVEMISREAVLGYLDHLPELLATGSPSESRMVLRTFVKEVVKDWEDATIRYTIPLPPGQVSMAEGVLDIDKAGGPGRVRTYDQSVMSRPLYH